MTWPVLALALVGLAIAMPVTAVLVRAGHRLGALDSAGVAGHEKAALRDVPNIGGIAIYLAVAVPMLLGVLVVNLIDVETLAQIVPGLDEALVDRVRGTTPTAIALLVGLTALHVVGIIDDRRGLGPWPKLLVQAGAAAVLVIWFEVRLLTLLGTVPSIVLTILWIIVVTNAINFMDNMDGLAGGVSAVAGALFLAACLVNAQWFIAATLALLLGALLGFLVFNFPPAKIFMGDSGSLVIGFLLGVLTARTTYYHPDLGGGWYAVFMPVIVLAIPMYDFVTVTFIRLRKGQSPFVGDQQHFSHRLVQRGMSRRGAVIVIWAATAVTGIGGVALGHLAGWQALLVGVQTALVLVMIALFEHASRHAVGRGPGS
ncbi:MAG: MraY family glycosyltransferase [Planctomycetota bacterium]